MNLFTNGLAFDIQFGDKTLGFSAGQVPEKTDTSTDTTSTTTKTSVIPGVSNTALGVGVGAMLLLYFMAKKG